MKTENLDAMQTFYTVFGMVMLHIIFYYISNIFYDIVLRIQLYCIKQSSQQTDKYTVKVNICELSAC